MRALILCGSVFNCARFQASCFFFVGVFWKGRKDKQCISKYVKAITFVNVFKLYHHLGIGEIRCAVLMKANVTSERRPRGKVMLLQNAVCLEMLFVTWWRARASNELLVKFYRVKFRAHILHSSIDSYKSDVCPPLGCVK